jgi:hypothetical protein
MYPIAACRNAKTPREVPDGEIAPCINSVSVEFIRTTLPYTRERCGSLGASSLLDLPLSR